MVVTHEARGEILSRLDSTRVTGRQRLDWEPAQRVGARNKGDAASRAEGAIQVLQRAHAGDDVDAATQVGGGERLRPDRLLPGAPAGDSWQGRGAALLGGR